MAKLKNPGPIEFEAIIQLNTEEANSSAWVEFPYDLKKRIYELFILIHERIDNITKYTSGETVTCICYNNLITERWPSG